MRKAKNTSFKGLTRKQVNFIEELFEGSLKYSEVVRKHNVSRRVYRKWLGDENFVKEIAFRVESARMQSDMIMASCAPKAAEKLIGLSESEKEETSRKACLDIMSHRGEIKTAKMKCESTGESISTEAAERLLAAMAKEERMKEKG